MEEEESRLQTKSFHVRIKALHLRVEHNNVLQVHVDMGPIHDKEHLVKAAVLALHHLIVGDLASPADIRVMPGGHHGGRQGRAAAGVTA